MPARLCGSASLRFVPLRSTSPEAERLWIAPHAREWLAAAQLDSVAAVMESTAGRRVRTFAGRENWQATLSSPRGPVKIYLKKHRTRSFAARCWRGLRQACGLPTNDLARGWVEGRHISRLQQAGIPTLNVLACGQRWHEGVLESFVLTAELRGYQQLDHYLRDAVSPGSADRELVRALTREVAVLARRFHDLGMNHRDLYTCHVFVPQRDSSATPAALTPAASTSQPLDLRLIDLERAQIRRRRRRRWLVKDLAQLAYSACPLRVTCRDRVAFLKTYLGVRKLSPQHKRFAREILRKQQWMEWKLGPYGANPRGVPAPSTQESQP